MKALQKTDIKYVFSAKMSESLANAIRRSGFLLPIMAIDELAIEKNDSPLYDETLAHRIGLVPLKMSKDIKEDSVLKIKVNAKGPGYIYSDSIKGDVEVVYDRIPLTFVNEGQQVKLAGKTKVGTSALHAKFAAGIMTYRHASEITLPKKYKEAISTLFTNKMSEKGNNIVIKDDKENTLLDFCIGLCARDGEKYTVKDSGELIFSIESFGQMKPEEMFLKSAALLKSQLKSLKF